ncbi:unnamed protein product [Soboliphyme baturini]|uniref:PDGF_2 domain-containing protein n=1 Tax=Soboliphyme baturini TaxID=241478 RepID=A0A183J2M3_9BILA|nr:unnamed protein product [Soboliphyme baturini]
MQNTDKPCTRSNSLNLFLSHFDKLYMGKTEQRHPLIVTAVCLIRRRIVTLYFFISVGVGSDRNDVKRYRSGGGGDEPFVETIYEPVQSEDSCKIVSVCVSLPIVKQPGVYYFPACIDIAQCLGGCCKSSQQCHPTSADPRYHHDISRPENDIVCNRKFTHKVIKTPRKIIR